MVISIFTMNTTTLPSMLYMFMSNNGSGNGGSRSNNDMLYYMMIPYIVQFITHFVSQYIVPQITNMKLQIVEYLYPYSECCRIIEYNYTSDIHDSDDYNLHLQRAFFTYISNNDVKINDAKIKLVVNNENNYTASGWRNISSLSKVIKDAVINTIPLTYNRIHIPQDNIWFTISDKEQQHHGNSQQQQHNNSYPVQALEKITVEKTKKLTLYGHNIQTIDIFIKKIWIGYKSSIQLIKNNNRYFFLCNKKNERSVSKYDSYEEKLTFSRYLLDNGKTFNQLFLPFKKQLIGVLDDFSTKSGKYSLPGINYKLGLLLHGIPGSGKTTLIKAIANKLNRHIINISLSQVSTNKELFSIMYNLQFPQQLLKTGNDAYYSNNSNNYEEPQYTFDNVLFIIEDIDAISNIVKKRNDDERMVESAKRVETLGNGSEFAQIKLEEQKLKLEEQKLKLVEKEKEEKKEDKLNLAGILNVLDGVVDSPGRIVIITTNHPEQMDDALFRPGRIDYRYKFESIKEPELLEMIDYFYPDGLAKKERLVRMSKDKSAAYMESVLMSGNFEETEII
jgi:hypothetical protein